MLPRARAGVRQALHLAPLTGHVACRNDKPRVLRIIVYTWCTKRGLLEQPSLRSKHRRHTRVRTGKLGRSGRGGRGEKEYTRASSAKMGRKKSWGRLVFGWLAEGVIGPALWRVICGVLISSVRRRMLVPMPAPAVHAHRGLSTLRPVRHSRSGAQDAFKRQV